MFSAYPEKIIIPEKRFTHNRCFGPDEKRAPVFRLKTVRNLSRRKPSQAPRHEVNSPSYIFLRFLSPSEQQ
jgi:hypothetical protein